MGTASNSNTQLTLDNLFETIEHFQVPLRNAVKNQDIFGNISLGFDNELSTITEIESESQAKINEANGASGGDNSASLSPHESTVTSSNDPQVNALLGGYKWDSTTITYSFFSGGSYYGSETGVSSVSNQVKASVRHVLENLIEPLINVNFVEVSDSSSSYGQIRYMVSDGPSYAYAYYPLSSTNDIDSWGRTFKSLLR